MSQGNREQSRCHHGCQQRPDEASKIAARAVAFAINGPDDVDINEIQFRPTGQPV